MYLSTVNIEIVDDTEEILADILEGIIFLCTTVEGTYPLNRDFGINADIIDRPLPIVRQLLPIEYKDKIERFEPRVEVIDTTFTYDEDEMKLTPHISIRLADGWNESGEDEYDDLEEDEDDN